ncbi:MAG: hypothetical protein JSV94_06715 [Methanobacteriota archaeon]|nr:MAG: hypothetical protein JSV94_06715 [Euryarchaeota archaeon]
MAFVNMGTYRARIGKEDELAALLKEISQYMRSYPEKFEGLKSRKLYSRYIGGVYGEYVDIWEFENWVAYSEYEKAYGADKKYAEFWQKLGTLVEPSTYSWTNLAEVAL